MAPSITKSTIDDKGNKDSEENMSYSEARMAQLQKLNQSISTRRKSLLQNRTIKNKNENKRVIDRKDFHEEIVEERPLLGNTSPFPLAANEDNIETKTSKNVKGITRDKTHKSNPLFNVRQRSAFTNNFKRNYSYLESSWLSNIETEDVSELPFNFRICNEDDIHQYISINSLEAGVGIIEEPDALKEIFSIGKDELSSGRYTSGRNDNNLHKAEEYNNMPISLSSGFNRRGDFSKYHVYVESETTGRFFRLKIPNPETIFKSGANGSGTGNFGVGNTASEKSNQVATYLKASFEENYDFDEDNDHSSFEENMDVIQSRTGLEEIRDYIEEKGSWCMMVLLGLMTGVSLIFGVMGFIDCQTFISLYAWCANGYRKLMFFTTSIALVSSLDRLVRARKDSNGWQNRSRLSKLEFFTSIFLYGVALIATLICGATDTIFYYAYLDVNGDYDTTDGWLIATISDPNFEINCNRWFYSNLVRSIALLIGWFCACSEYAAQISKGHSLLSKVVHIKDRLERTELKNLQLKGQRLEQVSTIAELESLLLAQKKGVENTQRALQHLDRQHFQVH